MRLNNWEFEIKFSGKRCAKIDLICESVAFLATKSTKKEIAACHFKIPIIQNTNDLKSLSPQIHGYLNRLGKKNLCNQSSYVNNQIKSLLSFAEHKPLKVNTFNYKPYVQGNNQKLDPLSALSA